MMVHSRNLVEGLPTPELRSRIRDHFAGVLVPLEAVVTQIRGLSDAVIAGAISAASNDNPNAIVLTPTPKWAFGIAHFAKTFDYPLAEVGRNCPALDSLITNMRNEISVRIDAMENWALQNGAQPYDFGKILTRGDHSDNGR